MISGQTASFRCLLALLMVFAIHLAGMERALAAASTGADEMLFIPGVATVHICHAGTDGGTDPGQQTHHDCCDECGLCAPAMLPTGPDLTHPAQAVRFVEHAQAISWAPVFIRHRTPRLSQGPPAA